MIWEIEQNEVKIQSVTGVNTDLFRAPYSVLNDELVEKIGELNYLGVGWSVDSEDWRSLSANNVKENILNGVHPGAIILMPSAGHWTRQIFRVQQRP